MKIFARIKEEWGLQAPCGEVRGAWKARGGRVCVMREEWCARWLTVADHSFAGVGQSSGGFEKPLEKK